MAIARAAGLLLILNLLDGLHDHRVGVVEDKTCLRLEVLDTEVGSKDVLR